MIDKIFKYVNSTAIGLAEKNLTKIFDNNRNKIFIWMLILFATFTGITTYMLGECINCDDITRKEVREMLDKVGEEDTEFVNLYEERTYKPFTTIVSFLKVWLLNTLPSIITFSLVIFGVSFGWTFLKNKVLNIKDDALKNIWEQFGVSKINKK